MDIMEQIKTNFIKVAENTTKVYQAGYNKGKSEGEQESTIDNAYYINHFSAAFSGAEFPENFELVLRTKYLASGNSFNGTFNNCANLKTLKLINESNTDLSINGQNTFARGLAKTPTLELIDLTEFNRKFSSCLNTFRYQEKLKSVLGKIDLSICTSTANMFQNCYALEDVEFESETIKISISFAQSSKLSATSINSIIDGLATVETAQTLTLSASQNVLQSQIDSANAKGWTVVGGKLVQEVW